jgi:hypothetical protein
LSGKFEGNESLLQGYYYDISAHRSPEQFTRTTEAISGYVSKHYKDFTDNFMAAVIIQNIVIPTTSSDPDPTNVLQLELWKIEIREYQVRDLAYRNFLASLYSLVLGQCTEAL